MQELVLFNTLEAIEYTDHAERTGADAALVVTPYYNKPTQTGLFEHYKAIAENKHTNNYLQHSW